MCELASRFRAEVTAVMEVLVKVAVVEITKVLEVHSRDCSVNRDDVRAHMHNALMHASDKRVCSVGVQVEETLLLRHNDEKDNVCPPESNKLDDLCPSETLFKETSQDADVHCSIIGHNGIGLGKGDGVIGDAAGTGDVQTQETIKENGLAESTTCSLVDPDVSPLRSVVASIPSKDLSTDTTGQLDLGAMEVGSLPSMETPQAEPPQSSKTTAEPARSSSGSNAKSSIQAIHTLNLKKMSLQLSQTPLDCKLLRPCSVQLVNLLMLSRAVKRTNASTGNFSSTHKDLRTHQNVHTGRRLCCFTECGDGIWRLQRVLERGHPLACKTCGKKFKRRKILKRHERFHTGEKPYSCRRCKKRFALRKNLRRHERFHTGERPHNCSHCGKGFHLKNNLKAHLRFHTGEKPYVCDMCLKSFRISKNLEKHRLTHTTPARCRSNK